MSDRVLVSSGNWYWPATACSGFSAERGKVPHRGMAFHSSARPRTFSRVACARRAPRLTMPKGCWPPCRIASMSGFAGLSRFQRRRFPMVRLIGEVVSYRRAALEGLPAAFRGWLGPPSGFPATGQPPTARNAIARYLFVGSIWVPRRRPLPRQSAAGDKDE
jgi:hypothetical protein